MADDSSSENSPRDAVREFPTTPGVYLMKDKDESIIYVGKAKNIKKRVTSYFHSKNHTPKTQELVHNIEDIDFIISGFIRAWCGVLS